MSYEMPVNPQVSTKTNEVMKDIGKAGFPGAILIGPDGDVAFAHAPNAPAFVIEVLTSMTKGLMNNEGLVGKSN